MRTCIEKGDKKCIRTFTAKLILTPGTWIEYLLKGKLTGWNWDRVDWGLWVCPSE